MKSKPFFDKYEKANKEFDIHSIASCYGDTFLFCQPQGVQAVKKEDFLKALPKRKEFSQKLGLISSTIVSMKEAEITEQYLEVKVTWNMRYKRDNEIKEEHNIATYLLCKKGDSFEIITQIDHQDLLKKYLHEK